MTEYNKHGEDIAARLMDFAVHIIKLFNELPTTIVGRHIGGQILRAGTSAGANYEEARGAQSRSDFIHKMSIVLKELKESRFWLKLIMRSKLVKENRMKALLLECEALCGIIAKSILTARKSK